MPQPAAFDPLGPAGPVGLGGLRSWRAPDRLTAYAALAVASFLAYIAARLLEGPLATAFAAFGVSACGWSWLLARALFDPAPRDAWWPRVVVGLLTGAGAVSVLGPEGGAWSIAGNLYVLSGSAAVLLTFIEPFQPHRCVLSKPEVRFRIAFLAVFAALVGVAVLGTWATPGPIQTACAVVGLVTALGATAFRRRHPLKLADRIPPARRAATEEDARLAEQLLRLFREEEIHTEPNLRIGDVAARLGQPEYRISACVGASLGFSNFNRLINHYRVEQAKRLLLDPDERASILQIAFACGFASLGPFNRAFKAQTGATPKAFRAAQGAKLRAR